MNRDFTYEIWVQWSALSKEEQDELIDIAVEQQQLIQEYNNKEVV